MAEKERWKADYSNGKTLEAKAMDTPKTNALMEEDLHDEIEEQLEDVGIIKPPDGGYGWV